MWRLQWWRWWWRWGGLSEARQWMFANIFRWPPHILSLYLWLLNTKIFTWNRKQYWLSLFITSSGRPTGPPPSYPPPPVPVTFPHHQDSSPGQKSLHPPIPLQLKAPTSPLHRKPSPCPPSPCIKKESTKGPPPPLPFAPHLQNPFPSTPPPIPPNGKKPGRSTSVGVTANDKRDWRPTPSVSVQSPATLPICEKLDRLILNGPCPPHSGGSQSLENSYRRNKPNMPVPPCPNTNVSLNLMSSSHPSHSPLPKPGLLNKPSIPKPPLPLVGVKPSMAPPKPKSPGTPFQ